MTTNTQFELHPKQLEIFSLEEVQFHASLLLREMQTMLIEHGETKTGVEIEQDIKQVLVKIRKMLKELNDVES